jgi:hypothetical protein
MIYDSGYVPVGILNRNGGPRVGPKAPAPLTSALIAEKNPVGNQSFEWMAVDWMDDYAMATGTAYEPENVARYVKYNRYGTAAGWGMCIEVRNPSGSNMPLHGFETDLCADGNDPNGWFCGQGIYYGAQTDTFKPGPETVADVGLRIRPFVFGRNGLRKAISVEGRMEDAAIVVGQHGESDIRFALRMGPGVTLKFDSGSGKHKSAWHSLPAEASVADFPVVGLLDVVVDGTTLQIPVFRKTVGD